MDVQKMTMSVPQAGRLLGAGRCLAYRLAREGRLPCLRLGRKQRVPRAALEKMLEEAGGRMGGAAR